MISTANFSGSIAFYCVLLLLVSRTKFFTQTHIHIYRHTHTQPKRIKRSVSRKNLTSPLDCPPRETSNPTLQPSRCLRLAISDSRALSTTPPPLKNAHRTISNPLWLWLYNEGQMNLHLNISINWTWRTRAHQTCGSCRIKICATPNEKRKRSEMLCIPIRCKVTELIFIASFRNRQSKKWLRRLC